MTQLNLFTAPVGMLRHRTDSRLSAANIIAFTETLLRFQKSQSSKHSKPKAIFYQTSLPALASTSSLNTLINRHSNLTYILTCTLSKSENKNEIKGNLVCILFALILMVTKISSSDEINMPICLASARLHVAWSHEIKKGDCRAAK